jgi:hypothetical protein
MNFMLAVIILYFLEILSIRYMIAVPCNQIIHFVSACHGDMDRIRLGFFGQIKQFYVNICQFYYFWRQIQDLKAGDRFYSGICRIIIAAA